MRASIEAPRFSRIRLARRANNRCGVRGVYRDGNRWVAQVHKGRRHVHAGMHATLEEAAAAAACKRAEVFKDPDDVDVVSV
jgi:hypothetical protein